MARSGVQFEDVQRAIDDLLSRGETPSVQKVREVLGTGSFTTISDHLREWRTRREENRDVPPPRGMPGVLQELAEGLWHKAQESANETLGHYREEADRRVEEAEVRVAEARRQAEDTQQRESALAAHLASTEQRLEERNTALARGEAQREQLDEKIQRLETRHAELEGLLTRIRGEMSQQALEHQQAVSALETRQRERLTREEQRHESAEARLMGLLDEARQERQAGEKSAAEREKQLGVRVERLERQLLDARGKLAEEEKHHREADWARRQAETLADTRQHEQALLQARIDEQKRLLEEQARRLRDLERQLHRCLWQTPPVPEVDEEAENDEGPAVAEPSEER
ncbi:DNA-binding protein [Halomonas sp.]|uniref:DNA-binding protein n=1 Tax=Halomonas sp. TaxID=1486246 RepID=UPI0025B98278|nr:DNA-binding protein [Halomonas sp.]